MPFESPSPASSPEIVTPASAAGKRRRRAPSPFGAMISYPSDLAEQFADFEALLSAEPPKKTPYRTPVSKTFCSKSTQTESEKAVAVTSELLGPPFSEDEVTPNETVHSKATLPKQPKASPKAKSTASKVVYKDDSEEESLGDTAEEDDGSAFTPSPVASDQEAPEAESEFQGGSDTSERPRKKSTSPSKRKAKPSAVKSSANTNKPKPINKKVTVDDESESDGDITPSPKPSRSNNAKTPKTSAKPPSKKSLAVKIAAVCNSEEEYEQVTPKKASKKTAKEGITPATESEVEEAPATKTKSKPKSAAGKSSSVTKPISEPETASESEHEAPVKKSVKKKLATKKAIKEPVPASDSDDRESDKQPVKVKKPAPKRTKPVSTSATEDEAPRKKTKAVPKVKASKARSASVAESEEDGHDEVEVEKPKKKAPVKSKECKADDSDGKDSEAEEKPLKKSTKTVKRKRSPSLVASEAESQDQSQARAKAKKVKKDENGDKPAKAPVRRTGPKQQTAILTGFDVDAIKSNKQLWTSISEEVDIPESKIRRHWRGSLFPDILAFLQGSKSEGSKATKDFTATTRQSIASKVLEQYASADWDSIVGECPGYTATQLKRNCRGGMTSSIKKFLKA